MTEQEQQAKFKEKAAKLAVAYGKVFDSEEGRLVLFDLMRVTNFDRSPFQTDPYATAYEAGRQSIVHEIVRAKNLNLEEYLEVIEDSNTAQKEDFNV